MPEWLTILISAFVTLLLSGFLVPICTKIVGRKMTKYFDDKDKEKQVENEKAKRLEKFEREEAEKKLEEKIDAIVEKHTNPIDQQLEVLADGTTDMLRERILSTYYKCIEKGFRTQYDFENIEHMHQDYVLLGGNSFVATCVKTIKELPSEEEWKKDHQPTQTRKPRKPRKKLLVEDK